MIKILASSSKGNCYRYFNVLVDIGVPYKTIEKELKEINVICLTHRHVDHLNIDTLRKVIEEFNHIKIVAPTYLVEVIENIVPKERLIVQDVGYTLNLGVFSLTSVKLYHDVQNIGYSLIFKHIKKGGYKIMHATDTAHLQGISAKGYDLYVIECSYDEDDKERLIAENGNLPIVVGSSVWKIIRSANSHLSKQQCYKFIEENNTNNGRFVPAHVNAEFYKRLKGELVWDYF